MCLWETILIFLIVHILPGSEKWDSISLFCILDIFLEWERLGEYLCSDIRQVLLVFRTKVPVVMPTISNFVYFSFLPVKQRDFPGNVRSGGCDSLPLVVAFTSKQHDSPLSYALHFLRIISHRMCCAGERAEGRACQPVEKSLHIPDKKCKKSKSFLIRGDLAVKGNKSALCLA